VYGWAVADSVFIPKVLSIAGVDPSGGAGVLADIKTFSALGAYGTGVITALTAQNTRTVSAVYGVPPSFVREQLDTLFADVRIDAVKIGMLGSASVVQSVSEGLAAPLARHELPHLVLDPVTISKSGAALLSPDATALLIETLIPLVNVITPNLSEAGALLQMPAPETLEEMRRAAERLRRLLSVSGSRWVLLKGGHLVGDAIDLLYDGTQMLELPASRLATRHTHGTGCALSAALTALLPRASDVPSAVRAAKHYVTEAIAHADELQIGSDEQGHGPVHHLWQVWSRLNA
jgi:hydroxymethylpyrimidine/phosphomethylpyrimidine kinase